ncbi:MAG TPA: hypothetical protein VMG12_42910, partial [Polyangiaceae bacterium]|nr:hypothetical protein [Polyangiaceae bacterium]
MAPDVRRWARAVPLSSLVVLAAACGTTPPETGTLPPFRLVAESDDAAFLSVSGTAADDVWLAGADAGRGPRVLHWDGESWSALDAGVDADLWWVQALPD